jgi:hypothetical protein
MDFIKDQAEKYMNKGNQQQGGEYGQQGGGYDQQQGGGYAPQQGGMGGGMGGGMQQGGMGGGMQQGGMGGEMPQGGFNNPQQGGMGGMGGGMMGGGMGGGMPQQGGQGRVNFSDGVQASDIMGLMGKGGSGINLMDGIQMGDLKGLAGAFSKVKQDPNMDSNNPDHVVQSMGGPQQASNAMGGLLSAFKKQTGQDYTGDEQQTNMLSSLAHQVTGTNIPPSVLGKLAKSQLSGMF